MIIKKFIHDNRGAALIETAIAIQILLALFFAFFYFSFAMRYHLVMSMASKEGARTYKITKKADEAIDKAHEELALGGVGDATVTITSDGVEVIKPYGFYVPFAKSYLLNLKTYAEFQDEIDLVYFDEWK